MHTLYINYIFSSNTVQLVSAYASSIPLIHFSVATSDVCLFTIFSESPFRKTKLDEKYVHANATYTCCYTIYACKYGYATYTQSFHNANALYFWSFGIQVHMAIS